MTAAAGRLSDLSHHDHGLSYNPWLVALTVTIATFMEVLDTSIANVSLPHIAGSLSASQEESTWVLTSYLVSNAVVLPLSGWLTALMGRKRFNMTCVFMFTLSSALCGMAPSLRLLIFFRILQGIGGGGLQPSVQAILLDTFSTRKRGMAMAVYAIAILVAPVIGPTLGGWITDSFSWRWIFYINVPVGIFSLIGTQIVLSDPPYLIAQRAAARKAKPIGVDFVGLSLIAIGLATLEIVLDEGQEKDWFSSHLIVNLSIIAIVALVCAVIWELRHPHPIVNLRLFGERNFAMCCLVIFFVFASLYSTTVLLPQMLQTLMGYTAMQAGLVLSPAGLVAMAQMPLLGYLLTRGFDARRMIICGMCLVVAAVWLMSHLNLQVTEGQVIFPRILQVAGGSMIFVPINTVAFRFIPRTESNNASGLFALIRNEAASIGVASVTTLLQRHQQVNQNTLIQHINPLNPLAQQAIHGATSLFTSGDPTNGRAALRLIYETVQRQAGILSYLEMYRLFAVVTLLAIPLVFLMRRVHATTESLGAH